MKNCVNCTKDLPDTAMHCVFCGSKQPPAGAAGQPDLNARTVMGFGGAEVAKEQRPGATGGHGHGAPAGGGATGAPGVAQTIFVSGAQPAASPAAASPGAAQAAGVAQPPGVARTMFAGSQAGVPQQVAPRAPSGAHPGPGADHSGPMARTMFGSGPVSAALPGVPQQAPRAPSGAFQPGSAPQGDSSAPVARTMFASGQANPLQSAAPQPAAPQHAPRGSSGPFPGAGAGGDGGGVARTMFASGQANPLQSAAPPPGAPAHAAPRHAPRGVSGPAPAAGAAGDGAIAKTVFAMDLSAQAPQGPHGGPADGAMAQTVMAAPGGLPPGGPPAAAPDSAMAQTVMAAPGGLLPGGPPAPHGGPPAPHGGPPGGHSMAPPPAAPVAGPPPAAPAGPHGHGHAPAHGGHAHAPAAPDPMTPPVQYANQPRPQTAHVAALHPPPYLASQTATRMEPWSEGLPVLMGVFGALLVACFVLPWTVSETSWAWSVFGQSGAPWQAKLRPLLLISTGFLAVVMGVLPLATRARGIAAMLLGLTPLLVSGLALVPRSDVHTALSVLGLIALVPGLLLRASRLDSVAARVITTIGVGCVLLAVVIPSGGQVPLVGLLEQLGVAPGKARLGAIFDILPVVLALIALVVWIPAPSGAGALTLAWLFMTWPVIDSVMSDLVLKPGGVPFGAHLKQGLYPFLWAPISTTAWLVLGGFGAATVIGNAIGRR